MTFSTKVAEVPRRRLLVANLKVDRCPLTNGTSPCTASPSTGEECFNTFGTCQDRANYTGRVRGTAQGGAAGYITLESGSHSVDGAYAGQVRIIAGTGRGQLRTVSGYTGSTKQLAVASNWTTVPDATSEYEVFNLADHYHAEPIQPWPIGFVARPDLVKLGGALQTKIRPGEGMSRRGQVTIEFQDTPSTDRDGVDPYLSTRTYDPESQGTYWGKWRARNKHYRHRPIEIHVGYLQSNNLLQATASYVDYVANLGPTAYFRLGDSSKAHGAACADYMGNFNAAVYQSSGAIDNLSSLLPGSTDTAAGFNLLSVPAPTASHVDIGAPVFTSESNNWSLVFIIKGTATSANAGAVFTQYPDSVEANRGGVAIDTGTQDVTFLQPGDLWAGEAAGSDVLDDTANLIVYTCEPSGSDKIHKVYVNGVLDRQKTMAGSGYNWAQEKARISTFDGTSTTAGTHGRAALDEIACFDGKTLSLAEVEELQEHFDGAATIDVCYERAPTIDLANDVETYTYVLEKIEGPDSRGKVRVTCQDLLNLADDKKAQYPQQSEGTLAADITGAPSTFACGAGEGAAYPASGVYRIDSECIRATRTTDTFTIVARGEWGTEQADHSAGTIIQECVESNENVADFIRTMLAASTNVWPDAIDETGFDEEKSTWLSTFSVDVRQAKPLGVTKWLDSLSLQFGISVYWSPRESLLKLLAMKPPQGTPETLNKDDHFLKGSISVGDDTTRQVTRVEYYYGIRNPLGDVEDDDNYEFALVVANADAEDEAAYGEKSIRKIYAPNVRSATVPISIANRYALRFGNPPVVAQVKVDAKDYALTTGDEILFSADQCQDKFGATLVKNMQIVSIGEVEPGHTRQVELLSSAFETAGGGGALPQIYGYVVSASLASTEYSAATVAQQELQPGAGWVGENSGNFSDGRPPYKII